jgi:hypothetical protein
MKFRAVVRSEDDGDALELSRHPVQKFFSSLVEARDWAKGELQGHPHRFVVVYETREILADTISPERVESSHAITQA